MPNPPSYDQHLLDRLNALKKSSVQIDSPNPSVSPLPKREATPESNLSDRLRTLRNGSFSPSPSPAAARAPALESTSTPPTAQQQAAPLVEEHDPLLFGTDDQTLEDLLADLGPEDQWTLDPDDPKDIQKLLDEAKGALPGDDAGQGREEGKEDEKSAGDSLTRGLDMSVFTSEVPEEDSDSEEKGKVGQPGLGGESREVQDILARLMDEVHLEKQNEHEEGRKREEHGGTQDNDSRGGRGFELPSAPSAQPKMKTDEDFTNDINSRLAALSSPGSNSLNLPSTPQTITDSLGLPSAPTFKPTEKQVPGLAKKGFSEEEIDSWCIICQDDATVECEGCDGDLYCALCWKEGHMGPDAGREEKSHAWRKYRRPN